MYWFVQQCPHLIFFLSINYLLMNQTSQILIENQQARLFHHQNDSKSHSNVNTISGIRIVFLLFCLWGQFILHYSLVCTSILLYPLTCTPSHPATETHFLFCIYTQFSLIWSVGLALAFLFMYICWNAIVWCLLPEINVVTVPPTFR